MVSDYDKAVGRLGLLAGLSVLEYSESEVPEVGRRGGMTWIGDNSIELGQPIVEGGGADRFVARTGGGMHSIAVQVTDLDATIAHLDRIGVRVAARPDPHFCFTDPRATHGVFVEWADVEVPEDPRFGPPPSAPAVTPVLDVTHHGFAGAVVDDPVATAEQFGRLLDTHMTFDHADAAPGEPRIGVSLGDCTLALYDMPGDDSVDLWGRHYDRPRTHLLGLTVADLAATVPVLAANGFGVVRRSDTMIVLDPTSTGDVQIALMEDLLPGDPRC